MDDHARTYNGRLMKKGQQGEAMVLDFLTFRKTTDKLNDIKDVRSDPKYQRLDIDFIVTYEKSGAEISIAVDAKVDGHIGQSGNFLYELCRLYLDAESQDDFFRAGWSTFSKADVFLIWSPKTEELYSVTRESLQAGLKAFVTENKRRRFMSMVKTDKHTRTINAYVPEKYFDYKVYKKSRFGWEKDREHKA